MRTDPKIASYRVVSASDLGVLPPQVRAMESGGGGLPTAGGWVAPDELLGGPGGPAWKDSDLQAQLQETHARMEADEVSSRSLSELAGGAACVITGQQPGLLGGPLYTFWKVLGAVALAKQLSRLGERPVVPVFWCASDDADFDEARRAWLSHPERATVRVELPVGSWVAGQMVGSLSAAEVWGFEAKALKSAGFSPGDPHLGTRDWGELFGARMLEIFRGTGLVVVDARLPALIRRGEELFLRYAANSAAIAQTLHRRGEELAGLGWPVALSDRAVSSGLYRVRGSRRERVPSSDHAGLRAKSAPDLRPSVMLRALWQDRELSPVAVVLGPGEISYHAQLAPLYERFEVRPPATVPRPHGVFLPPGWSDGSDEPWHWLATEDSARDHLLHRALPASWLHAVSRHRADLTSGLEALKETVDASAEPSVERMRRRSEREWGRLLRALGRGAATGSVERELGWLWPQGRPQERSLAVEALRRSEESVLASVLRSPLGHDYCEALSSRRIMAAVLHMGSRT